jgi:hypothetical protein
MPPKGGVQLGLLQMLQMYATVVIFFSYKPNFFIYCHKLGSFSFYVINHSLELIITVKVLLYMPLNLHPRGILRSLFVSSGLYY